MAGAEQQIDPGVKAEGEESKHRSMLL